MSAGWSSPSTTLRRTSALGPRARVPPSAPSAVARTRSRRALADVRRSAQHEGGQQASRACILRARASARQATQRLSRRSPTGEGGPHHEVPDKSCRRQREPVESFSRMLRGRTCFNPGAVPESDASRPPPPPRENSWTPCSASHDPWARSSRHQRERRHSIQPPRSSVARST